MLKVSFNNNLLLNEYDSLKVDYFLLFPLDDVDLILNCYNVEDKIAILREAILKNERIETIINETK